MGFVYRTPSDSKKIKQKVKRKREPQYHRAVIGGGDNELSLDTVYFQLMDIEACQKKLAGELALLHGWLDRFPTFRDIWKRFQSAGGVTSTDFEKFCEGTMRHRQIPERKHLRLISSTHNKAMHRVRLRSSSEDDDVA